MLLVTLSRPRLRRTFVNGLARARSEPGLALEGGMPAVAYCCTVPAVPE